MQYIQLFQERFFYKRIKEYATKSKGIMGKLTNGCLIEAKGISSGKSTSACRMLFFRETLLTPIKKHRFITAHNTNWHCRFRFQACVGQPLSKQLSQTLETVLIGCPNSLLDVGYHFLSLSLFLLHHQMN